VADRLIETITNATIRYAAGLAANILFRGAAVTLYPHSIRSAKFSNSDSVRTERGYFEIGFSVRAEPASTGLR
jgi:hypothetical protein